jgi:hypothetical protein
VIIVLALVYIVLIHLALVYLILVHLPVVVGLVRGLATTLLLPLGDFLEKSRLGGLLRPLIVFLLRPPRDELLSNVAIKAIYSVNFLVELVHRSGELGVTYPIEYLSPRDLLELVLRFGVISRKEARRKDK